MKADLQPVGTGDTERRWLLDKALGLRTSMQFYKRTEYVRVSECDDREKRLLKQMSTLVMDVIHVADRLEDSLRMFHEAAASGEGEGASEGKSSWGFLSRRKKGGEDKQEDPGGGESVRSEDAEDAGRTAPLLESYEVVLQTLGERLAVWGIHRVPLVGQKYDQVEFQGMSVRSPYKVAGPDSRERPREARANTVSRVLRSLWVQVDGHEARVFRRGEVNVWG